MRAAAAGRRLLEDAFGGPLAREMLYTGRLLKGRELAAGPCARYVAPRREVRTIPGALPPPPARSASSWRARPNTAELVSPPSVTENTTRLLEKEDRTDR